MRTSLLVAAIWAAGCNTERKNAELRAEAEGYGVMTSVDHARVVKDGPFYMAISFRARTEDGRLVYVLNPRVPADAVIDRGTKFRLGYNGDRCVMTPVTEASR